MPQSYGLIKYEPRKTGNNNLLIEIRPNYLIYSTLKLPPPLLEAVTIFIYICYNKGKIWLKLHDVLPERHIFFGYT